MDLTEVRLKEHLGIVTGETSTGHFSFFVTPLRNKTWVGKEDYVVIEHPVLGERCPLIAVVREIKNYEEVVGSTVNEKSVKATATADVLGYVDLRDDEKRPLQKSFMAPSPGSKVYLPYLEFLEDLFLRDFEGKPFEHALHVGSLESHAPGKDGSIRQLDFCLDAKDFEKQHFLISAMTGAGKTHTATVIVEELASKAGWPIVVLDSYGEYTTVGLLAKRLREGHSFNFGVSIHSCDSKHVADKLGKFEIASGKASRFSVETVADRWLKTLDGKMEAEIRDELKGDVKPNHVVIIDSKGVLSGERRKLFTNCVRALWRGRVEGSVKPFVLVVEEPEFVEAEMLERVASEGRKFGVTMCLLSQHPSGLSSRVSSQLGFQFMGRTTNAADLECLTSMAGEKSVLLPQLARGEWIVGGISLRPTKVYVRVRYSVD